MDAETALKIWDCQPALLRRARKLVREPADAEDIVSETILRALAANHDGNPNLMPWLYTILRNNFINLVKSPYAVRRDWDDDFSDVADLPNNYDADLLKDVLRFIPRMKEDDASILVLAALGNNCGDMAKRLSISPQAAQSRWFRAAKRLREIVGAEDVRRAEKLSRYRGVTPHQGKWRVRLRVSNKQMVGKSGIESEIAAARYYNYLAITHLGDGAVLNDLPIAV